MSMMPLPGGLAGSNFACLQVSLQQHELLAPSTCLEVITSKLLPHSQCCESSPGQV